MRKLLIASFVIVISSLMFYFSMGFHDIGWLMWIAPVPVLVYSYYESFFRTFCVAFITGLAVGLNGIIGYWSTTIPPSAFIDGALWQSIEWTLVILLSRYFMRQLRSPICIFAYPTFLALCEWLVSFTIQGTFTTIAYSQLQTLPVIQISALTGYWGVSFILSLFAATLAYTIIFWREKRRALTGFVIGMLIVVVALLYGHYRLHLLQNQKPAAEIKVALISVNRNPNIILNPQYADMILAAYQSLMKIAVSQRAELILFPEESFTVSEITLQRFRQWFENFAKQNKVKLIVGVRNKQKSNEYNSAWVIDEHGKWLGEYHKRHFVPVVEDGLTQGVDLLTLPIKENNGGIAICRDMDYLKPANDYGALGTQILFVPAWDFVADAKVHAAGAWLRGIENGYTLVRAARSGYLSVSAPSGEILAKVPAFNSAILVTIAPIYLNQSFFAKHQHWFIIILWLLFIGMIVCLIRAGA